MSYQAVEWAMRDAPMLLTEKGRPDTTARHVLAALAEHAHPDGSEARPAIVTLQHRTGYDRRTVQRALRRLETAGLIRDEGTKYDCTIYRLAMHLMRPASDLEELKADEMRQKEASAERQRRSRARRVTHSDDVTVTDADCVTEPDVTDADDVSHVVEMRDVTHSASARHALSAALTIKEPPSHPPENQPADGRRPSTGSSSRSSSGFAAPADEFEKVSAADIRAVVAGLPEPVRMALGRAGRHTPLNITNVIRTEILRGIPPQRLIERAGDRWHIRGYIDAYRDGKIQRPIGVADALLRNDCTSPRCDDGTDIDTRQPCRTCERAREDYRKPATDQGAA